MLKNLIMYADFSGKEKILPLDKEINGVDFNEIVSFTVVNQKCRVSNCTSTTERYVVGIPYMYPNIKNAYSFDKKHLINDILNNGRQVTNEEANCCYEMLTGNICYKTSNIHIVSSQNELLKALMRYIKENEQTIVGEQKPASRTRR